MAKSVDSGNVLLEFKSLLCCVSLGRACGLSLPYFPLLQLVTHNSPLLCRAIVRVQGTDTREALSTEPVCARSMCTGATRLPPSVLEALSAGGRAGASVMS